MIVKLYNLSVLYLKNDINSNIKLLYKEWIK